ncbi:fibronectin type III domain-containing protein [Chryseobacterium vaccae]|uniref:fibronectin type III domain-containing protein n=1 Tax=Chryseobacterium vaccae TaxID=2604424 RepID=UPI001297F9DE|nr:fibronectin type III domain-containing protein [Chryseobacterium vaccae]
MRKHYLLFWMILLLPFLSLNAQTYCIPVSGGTNSTYYLKNAVFSDQGALYYDAAAYQAYVDNSASHTVTSYPGSTVKVHLEFAGNGTKALVWVDWNANGDFNDFYENPIGVSGYSTVDDQFFVPPTLAPGIYRIRVQTGTTLTTSPNPCGPNAGNNGNFVDFSLKIEPAAPTCFVPSSLTSNNITTSTASISWTAPSTAPGNGYEYYYTSSAAAPDASATASGGSSATSASISGLDAFTTYYYYVRSVCSASSKSAWSLRGIFKTKCNPVTSMFQDFESGTTGTLYNLDCWDKIILGNGTQSINNTVGVNGSKGMYQYANGAANTVIAVLPAFSNVNAGTHWLRFKAKVSSGTGTLDVGYVTNDTDASSFVNIQSVTMTNTTMDGYEYSVVIPNTVPANARLAVRHGGVPNTIIYWDNMYWEPKPTCFTPGNIVLSNATSSGADISWTAAVPAPASGYDIYYSTSNIPPTSTTPPNVTGTTANSYTLQGLNSATTYYIWVRSRCSSTDQSTWSNIASVLTLCAPKTSLFENFEAYNNGSIASVPCWGRLTTGSGIVNVDAYSGGYSGTKQVFQRPVTGSSMAVLPELSNINAGTHSLKFRAYCSAATGKMKIGYVTNPTDINSFVLIQDVNITNTSYTGASEYVVAVPNTVPTNAKLAIFTTFADGGNVIYYYDDVSWAPTVALGVNEVTAKHDIIIYPNPFTDVITISGEIKLKSVVVYDASGKMVKELRFPEKTISLQELNAGVYMIRLIMMDGTSKTIKAVKK